MDPRIRVKPRDPVTEKAHLCWLWVVWTEPSKLAYGVFLGSFELKQLGSSLG